MGFRRGKVDKLKNFGGVLLLLAVIAGGFFGGEPLRNFLDMVGADRLSRQLQGEVLGSMPKPTQPAMSDPMVDIIKPKRTRRMVVKRIPKIKPGQRMPHGYWGPCNRCHLFKGGAPPGSQKITPVGKVWEKFSTIKKVGPPILPNSTIPHPPSGRCIKCHDIVIEVPI